MKYWWLSIYLPFFESATRKDIASKCGRNILKKFYATYSCFCRLPKHYLDYYQKIRVIPVTSLSDCGLQLLLSYYIYQGKIDVSFFEEKILNREIFLLISELLKMSDTSLPSTDETLLEMRDEIEHLPDLVPTLERVKKSNVAACYSCRNIFYIDFIYQKSKDKKCLCPYCNRSSIYFDSDYLPMDRNFLLLAYLFHQKEINYSVLVSFLKSRVIIKKESDILQSKDYFTFKDEEFELTNKEKRIVSYPFISKKKSISSKEEEILSLSIWNLLQKAEKERLQHVNILCNFSQSINQALYFSIVFMETLLLYYLQHYFTCMQVITIIIPDNLYDIYVKCYQDTI